MKTYLFLLLFVFQAFSLSSQISLKYNNQIICKKNKK